MTPAGPPDDPSIPGEAELWRRIPFAQWASDPSVATGFRPSSANFDDVELSVVIASECIGGLDTLLQDHDGFGVASFSVAEVHDLGWVSSALLMNSFPGTRT